jgi:hypothetical protein
MRDEDWNPGGTTPPPHDDMIYDRDFRPDRPLPGKWGTDHRRPLDESWWFMGILIVMVGLGAFGLAYALGMFFMTVVFK